MTSYFECVLPHALPYEDVSRAETKYELRAQRRRGLKEGWGWQGADSGCGSEETVLGRGWVVGGVGEALGRNCTTCGTHTAPNVTTATLGFKPLSSGSFLKRHDSCECTMHSLFKKHQPCRVQRHRLSLSLSLSLFSVHFSFVFLLFWRAGHAGLGVSLCFTLETIDACCLISSRFRHHPSASSFRRKVIANTHSFLCVCACAHVCVYIYIKRESNIYESIFFLFCDESY